MSDVPVEEVTTTRVKKSTPTMSGTVTQESVATTARVDTTEYILAKSTQVIWFLVGLICLLLASRFLLLVTAANNVGIAQVIFDLSYPFVILFFGLFPAPQYGQSYIDIASIIGIVFWVIMGVVITEFIRIFSERSA